MLDKERLLNQGFLNFNLKDLDTELYNNLYSTFDKKSALESITNLKYNGKINLDSNNHIHNDPDKWFSELILEYDLSNLSKLEYSIDSENFDTKTSLSLRPNLVGTFEKLSKLKKKLDTVCESTNQTWYFTSYINNSNISVVKKIHEMITTKLYPSESKNIKNVIIRESIDLTMYVKDDFIQEHSDGIDAGRYCVILIYLNDDYKNGYGGELAIDGSIVIKPEFGNITILDFTKNNIIHRVNPVLDDNFKRFAYIKFFYE